MDKETLTQQVNGALQEEFPGVTFNFSQTIEDNVEEAASGVKGANSVKLFGNDLETLERIASLARLYDPDFINLMTVRGDMTVEMSPFINPCRVRPASRTMASMFLRPVSLFQSGALANMISISSSWGR